MEQNNFRAVLPNVEDDSLLLEEVNKFLSLALGRASHQWVFPVFAALP